MNDMANVNLPGGMPRQPAERATIAEQHFGHNRAPVADALRADYADLVAYVSAELARLRSVDRQIKLGAAGDEAIAVEAVKSLRGIFAEVEAMRKAEGGPLFEAKKVIDGFFADLTGQVKDLGDRINRRLDDHANDVAREERRKAEEAAKLARAEAERERQRSEAAKSVQAASKADTRASAAEERAAEAEALAAAADSDLAKGRVGSGVSATTVWSAQIEDAAALRASMGPLGQWLDDKAIEAALAKAVKVQKATLAIPGVRPVPQTKTTVRR